MKHDKQNIPIIRLTCHRPSKVHDILHSFLLPGCCFAHGQPSRGSHFDLRNAGTTHAGVSHDLYNVVGHVGGLFTGKHQLGAPLNKATATTKALRQSSDVIRA